VLLLEWHAFFGGIGSFCLGMHWPAEVAMNVALAEAFRPAFGLAQLPRLTATIYKTGDQMRLAGARLGSTENP